METGDLDVVGAIDRQTEAIKEQTEAIKEQTIIMEALAKLGAYSENGYHFADDYMNQTIKEIKARVARSK